MKEVENKHGLDSLASPLGLALAIVAGIIYYAPLIYAAVL